MAAIIQFPCPACGTLLGIPLSMAATTGPCPHCSKEIVAPNPETGAGAAIADIPVLLPVPSPPPRPETPLAKPDPAPAPRTPAEPAQAEPTSAPPPKHSPPAASNSPFPDRLLDQPGVYVLPQSRPQSPPAAGDAPSPPPPRKATLYLLGLILTAITCIALGFLAGRFRKSSADIVIPLPDTAPPPEKPVIPTTPPSSHPPSSPPVPTPPTNPPVTPPVGPTGRTAPPPNAVATAEKTLRAFLEAPDWASRAAHVLYPDAIRGEMEAYSRLGPDGPTPFTSISVPQSEIDEETGNTLLIFQILTPTHPTGIPASVMETPGGWLVDWRTFIEFRDDLFKKLVDGPTGASGTFHLILQPPDDDSAQNQDFASFILSPPLPGRREPAFVRKNSAVYSSLSQAIHSGIIFTPVLEVAKRETQNGQPYLEILSLVATDWRPLAP